MKKHIESKDKIKLFRVRGLETEPVFHSSFFLDVRDIIKLEKMSYLRKYLRYLLSLTLVLCVAMYIYLFYIKL